MNAERDMYFNVEVTDWIVDDRGETMRVIFPTAGGTKDVILRKTPRDLAELLSATGDVAGLVKRVEEWYYAKV